MKNQTLKSIYMDHPEMIFVGLEQIDPEHVLFTLKSMESSFIESLDHRDKIMMEKFIYASGDVKVMSENMKISLFAVHRLMHRINKKAQLWVRQVA